MHLTLFIPDLLWPDVDHAAAYDFPGCDELARTLSLAEHQRHTLTRTASWESRLATLFGFSEDHPPLAALRKIGDGLPATELLLCTDPVNLNFIQQALVLSPIPGDGLSETDADALLQSLNTEFAGEGRFTAGPHREEANHWYFIADCDAPALPDLAACSRLAGRRVDADETRQLLGREGLMWINRIQMCLNQHPVNQAREALGLSLINSVWPWGLGQLAAIPATRFSHAHGDSALLAGLCLATQTSRSSDTGFEAAKGERLVTALAPSQAISQDDLAAWQVSVASLVSNWLTPALTLLTDPKGMLQSLTLVSPGTQTEHVWTLHRTNRALRSGLLQRWLGLVPKTPTLASLARSWSA